MKQLFLFKLLLITSLSFAEQNTFSFEYYERLIFIRSKVNSTDSLLFLFDTGANTSAIDSKTADRLLLQTVKEDTVEGSAGIIVVPGVQAKSVSIGKYRVRNIVFTKYDLNGSLAPPGMKLDGILGTDFFKHFVFKIDFANKTLKLSEKVPNPLVECIPFEMDNGIPLFRAIINGIPAWFRYDSGSSLFDTKDTYLNTTCAVFEKFFRLDTTLKPVTHFSGTGIGGTVSLPVYKAMDVRIGDIVIKHPYLILQPEQGYFAKPEAAGFFGNNLLEKFQTVTIDFIGKKLYLHQ